MAEHQGFDHDLFRDFLRPGLDHHNRFFRACDDEVELRGARLVVGRIDDKAVFDQADAHAGYGVLKRDIRQVKRRRGTGNRQHVGIIIFVRRQHERDHLRVVAVAFAKQRAQRAVNEPRGQGLFFRRAAFAAKVVAGDAPGGITVLAVFDREREKINIRARLRADRRD